MKKFSLLFLLVLAACDCDSKNCDTEKQASFITECLKNSATYADKGGNSIYACRETSRELFCKAKKDKFQ